MYDPYGEYSDYYPDECPECGSEKTYWINIYLGYYKCSECDWIIDDQYWLTIRPKLIKSDNYPEDYAN